jgi:hypothetical protein
MRISLAFLNCYFIVRRRAEVCLGGLPAESAVFGRKFYITGISFVLRLDGHRHPPVQMSHCQSNFHLLAHPVIPAAGKLTPQYALDLIPVFYFD